MTDKDYSLKAFNRFIDHAAAKGLLKRNTAQSRKAAANKIFGVLESDEVRDLRTVDLERAFEQFQNLHGMDYNPKSLQVYLSRTKTAVTDFEAFVDNPSSFKPSTQQRSTSKGKKKDSNSGNASGSRSEREGESDNSKDQRSDSLHVTVPVPLRQDLMVKINNLPADLTEVEAERIAAIVKAFAVTGK